MIDERKIRLIAELLKHLEEQDGEELGTKMEPPKAVGLEVTEVKPMESDPSKSEDKGPMEALLEQKEQAGGTTPDEGDELSDEELEEMLRALLK